MRQVVVVVLLGILADLIGLGILALWLRADGQRASSMEREGLLDAGPLDFPRSHRRRP